MSVALSLKHWRQMSKPYFLIKPEWEAQTLHFLEPLPKFLGWENQTFSWAILLKEVSIGSGGFWRFTVMYAASRNFRNGILWWYRVSKGTHIVGTIRNSCQLMTWVSPSMNFQLFTYREFLSSNIHSVWICNPFSGDSRYFINHIMNGVCCWRLNIQL